MQQWTRFLEDSTPSPKEVEFFGPDDVGAMQETTVGHHGEEEAQEEGPDEVCFVTSSTPMDPKRDASNAASCLL